MTQRRRVVLMQGAAAVAALLAGVLPRVAAAAGPVAAKGAFDAKSVADVMKSLGLAPPVASADVQLTAPDIAENGAVVPMTLATPRADVQKLMLLIDKNPNTLAAVFNVTPDVDPSFGTRVKMAQTSNVYAVAVTADNKVLFAQKEVKVTLGGCGG